MTAHKEKQTPWMSLPSGVFLQISHAAFLYRKAQSANQSANMKNIPNKPGRLNAILIFRQKSLTPSLNGRRYTVMYEKFCWSVISFAISSAFGL